MTQQQKFGGTNNELKPGDGVQIDKDTKYEYGADLQTEGAPLIDPGVGKEVVIRTFQFRMNQEQKDFSNKQAIFNSHAKQISTLLWGDGLVPYEAANPRIVINKKKKMYQIFVPCEAKKGVLFMDKPGNLSDMVKPSKKVSRQLNRN